MLAFGSLQSGDLAAARGSKDGKSADAVTRESIISSNRAAALARSATGGRVLDVRLKKGKRPQYRVKMLLDGERVRNLSIDAQSGAILK